MSQLIGKTPSESSVETRYLLLPNQTNQYGTAFGGVIMSWIDIVAALAAQRHCATQVVTAGMDSLSFRQPIRNGDHVILKAAVNFTGKTSMEVGVQVWREDPIKQESSITTTAHLTFVAIDEDNNPISVPPIIPETDDEKRRYKNAQIRMQARKELRKKLQK